VAESAQVVQLGAQRGGQHRGPAPGNRREHEAAKARVPVFGCRHGTVDFSRDDLECLFHAAVGMLDAARDRGEENPLTKRIGAGPREARRGALRGAEGVGLGRTAAAAGRGFHRNSVTGDGNSGKMRLAI